MTKIYGLLPAAVLSLRMCPFGYPKELLPVYYEAANDHEYIRPKLLIEHSLRALSFAKV